jgi:molybdate transport system ATP-binding protein
VSDTHLFADIELPLGRFKLDVSIQTRRHMTGLFGRSGSGKTSILEVIAGLRREVTGVVKLGGRVWQDSGSGVFLPPEQRGVGYVPQDGLLFPHLSVHENLCFGQNRRQTRSIDSETSVDKVIELLELGVLLGQSVGTLSGGEHQRVALGRALCSGPEILLLDEPLAALDQALRRKIMPFIRRIRDQFEIPIILVSHDSLEVQALCDDLLILEDGKLVAQGAPRDVLFESEVLSIEGGRGFENIIPCFTHRHEDGLTLVRLGEEASKVELRLLSSKNGQNNSRFVGIPARDIIVATEKPIGLSARNILPGAIESIQGVDNFRLVRVSLGSGIPALVVEITREGCEKLSLTVGSEVYLVIKSMACTLYEGRQDLPKDDLDG